MNRIYLDNAATTPVSNKVLRAMKPYFIDRFGNPSSEHDRGIAVRPAINLARRQVASAINAHSDEIYFTSGGSESDNTAIKGVAFANLNKGNHIITTAIEHHAVLNACKWLENHGFEVTYLPVDSDGFVNPVDVENAITDRTILISVMTANNEIGTIQPICEIGSIAHEKGVLFHTDAVQAIGAIPVDVVAMNVDLLSMSAHKFHGPKGVGALYIRDGVKIDPLIHGGSQEHGMRAGTENVAGIVGLGAAINIACDNLPETSDRVMRLRDKLIDGIVGNIPGVMVNGPRNMRLPNNCNVSIDSVDSSSLLLCLNLDGIACSSGSACNSGSLDPSHVLSAIGLTDEDARSSLRFTLGSDTTEEEIDYVLDRLPKIVSSLRAMNPM